MDVSALISSVGGVLDLARLLVDERDRQKAAAIKLDLTNKLIEVQAQVLQVQDAIIEKDRLIHVLTERNRDLESQESERLRYQLREVGLGGNFFAYELRPAAELSERKDEPTHFLCQPCLDIRQHKAVLKNVCLPGGRPFRLVCPACGNQIAMG
ncbi:hypothetical protein D3C76_708510 [compost metagenome]